MNGYALTAAIIQAIASLAWPAAFVAAVWLFRTRLTELLPLFRLKHKDWEASFRLDQAEKEAAELPQLPPPPAEAAPTPEEKSRFEQLAELSPGAAILEVRRDLEEAVRNAVQQNGLNDKGYVGMSMLIRMLRNAGVVDPTTSALLDDLRSIGNRAAHRGHTDEFTKEDALRFRDLADQAIRQLAFLRRP